jgi:hypothetical protein
MKEKRPASLKIEALWRENRDLKKELADKNIYIKALEEIMKLRDHAGR